MVLDGIGAGLWSKCDGTNTVEMLCDMFAREHGLSFHEARTAVTGYLGKLVQRGVLAMAVKEGK